MKIKNFKTNMMKERNRIHNVELGFLELCTELWYVWESCDWNLK